MSFLLIRNPFFALSHTSSYIIYLVISLQLSCQSHVKKEADETNLSLKAEARNVKINDGVEVAKNSKKISQKEVVDGEFVYEYEEEQRQINTKPFFTYTSVLKKKFNKNKLIEKNIYIKAWDFNNDGQYDYLEVLGRAGEITLRAYDLDFDGKVDIVEELHKDQQGKLSNP